MLRKICQCKREEIVEEMYSRMSVLCLNNKYCTLGVLFSASTKWDNSNLRGILNAEYYFSVPVSLINFSDSA